MIQVDNAKDLDNVMPMYNLIEYSNDYTNISGSLWQYCKKQPKVNITDDESFRFKSIFTDNNGNARIGNLEIAMLLKY